MKAQASLEMVVGLIILLVVAGVVISLVLHFIKPENIPSQENVMKLRDFQSKCEEYCKDYDSIEYCRYYATVDWDKNAEPSDLLTNPTPGEFWPTCEKRLYCFLAFPCKDRFGSGGLDTLAKCKKLLCQHYENKYGDNTDKISEALLDDINFEGCAYEMLPDEENWFIAGQFEDGC